MKKPSWLKNPFKATANGGGSSPDSGLKTEVTALQSKAGLNTFLGDIYQREGVVSEKIQETLGRVQGATVAIALAYDAADDATKADLETKGIIVDHPFIPNKKTVNASVLDAAKAQVTDFSITEEKVTEWADKAEHIAKSAAGATDAQIAEGLKINQDHDGINPDRDATKAIMIAPIYDALHPALGNYGKAIAAVHTATRSGFGDAQFRTTDKTERFNADIAANDPKWLRRMIKSAKKIHSDTENATPEDMKNVQDGLVQAVKLAKTAEAELGSEANLSTITPKIERYAEITKGWRAKLDTKVEATATKSATGNTGLIINDDGEDDDVEVAADPMAAVQAELEAAKKAAEQAADGAAAQAKSAFKGAETDSATALEEKNSFLQAMANGTGADNLANKPWQDFQKTDFLPFLQSKVDVTSTEVGKTVFTAKDNSYSFTVTPEGVKHDDTNNDVSAEEALISANLINLNAKAHKKGVTIGGTDEQKAMYAIAMKTESPDITINNQDEIDAIAPEIMAKALARFDSLLDERLTSAGKPDYKSIVEEEAANDNSATKPEEPKRAAGGPTGGKPT